MSNWYYRWKSDSGNWGEWEGVGESSWTPIEAITTSQYHFAGIRRDNKRGLIWQLCYSQGSAIKLEVQFSSPSILEQELLALELVNKTKKRKKGRKNENK